MKVIRTNKIPKGMSRASICRCTFPGDLTGSTSEIMRKPRRIVTVGTCKHGNYMVDIARYARVNGRPAIIRNCFALTPEAFRALLSCMEVMFAAPAKPGTDSGGTVSTTTTATEGNHR